jgi:hypothetical protein
MTLGGSMVLANSKGRALMNYPRVPQALGHARRMIARVKVFF